MSIVGLGRDESKGKRRYPNRQSHTSDRMRNPEIDREN